MATTSGNMKSYKVTDANGNVYVMTPVDSVARQAINGAKQIQFDSDYFKSEVSADERTVNVGLKGVPIGIDADSPLKFVQDDEYGIVLGIDIVKAHPKVAVTGTLDSSHVYTVDIPLHTYSTFTVDMAAVEIQVNVPTPSSGEFDEAEFKFTCQGGLLSAASLKFIQNGYVLPIVGNVSAQLDNTKQYQGRVADGIVTIAEAEKATPV